jgi:hypothetical protein
MLHYGLVLNSSWGKFDFVHFLDDDHPLKAAVKRKKFSRTLE